MRSDSVLELSQGTENGKVLGFGDVLSRWKRGKSSKHPQGFCSEDELLLLKGQQSMCVCGYTANNGPSRLCSSLPGLQRGHIMHSGGTNFIQWGCPFCKGEGSRGLIFQVSSDDCFALAFVLCTLLRSHPREQRHSLQGNCQIFEPLSVCQEHRKGTLTSPLQNYILMSSTPSPKATATLAKSSAEFLHPDN